MIVWICGQPGSGKTTLGKMLADSFCTKGVIRLDGDELRHYFADTDYSKKGRMANVRRAMGMALFLEAKGMIPICSLVSPYREQREWLKTKTQVIEVYLSYNDDRGKNDFYVKGYEKPESNCLFLNTSELSAIDCMLEIQKLIHIYP